VQELSCWISEKTVVFCPHIKTTQGSRTLRALQWHAEDHPTDPLVSSIRVCSRAGQEIDFLSCKLWYRFCQAGTSLWST